MLLHTIRNTVSKQTIGAYQRFKKKAARLDSLPLSDPISSSDRLAENLAAPLIECKPFLCILSSCCKELISMLWVRLVE